MILYAVFLLLISIMMLKETGPFLFSSGAEKFRGPCFLAYKHMFVTGHKRISRTSKIDKGECVI